MGMHGCAVSQCMRCADRNMLMLDHVQGTPGAPGGYYTAIPVPMYPPAEAPISIEGAIASQPVQVHFMMHGKFSVYSRICSPWKGQHTA